MKRKEMQARAIKQDNDARCFNAFTNDQNGSRHNKRAKRLASKRIRNIFRKQLREEMDVVASSSVV